MNQSHEFAKRHIGPSESEVEQMLSMLHCESLDALIGQTIPNGIRLKNRINVDAALSETEMLKRLKTLSEKNKIWNSFIGQGYYGTLTPGVIQRNIFENPGWYTQYTPYQSEISQGRLEALLNFQTMSSDLTGLPVANASLLDEATAAAEAMALGYTFHKGKRKKYLVHDGAHPQTLAVLRTRAEPLGIEIVESMNVDSDIDSEAFGVLFSYPKTDGSLEDYSGKIATAKSHGAICAVATDLLALCLIKSPGEMGADVAFGSSQRFGVPLGFGGPHAAFFCTRDEYKRLIPGRIIGVSKDVNGRNAYRLALQTREQHIRRDKATSNICTAQALLAIMASMYAVYHGPRGLTQIANRITKLAALFRSCLGAAGFRVETDSFFDTVCFHHPSPQNFDKKLIDAEINIRKYGDSKYSVTFDETKNVGDLEKVLSAVGESALDKLMSLSDAEKADPQPGISSELVRSAGFLSHDVFNSYRSETEMLRYIKRLESRDISLAQSMIPLGSCTMKLNATSELVPLSWEKFANLHPFVPLDQASGYVELIKDLENDLTKITGFAATSLQPNAGSQGEFAGLLVIKKHHESRGEKNRDLCLIPQSAHGTNPASASMAGMRVQVVSCDRNGNVDISDLKNKAEQNRDSLAAMMITYPSTHGVFEVDIELMCQIVHENGGQVYMDGANMNAQVGLCQPGKYGPDVIHLNLHKTFAIPHGGGGPGMGPICVAEHLVEYLPNHPEVEMGGKNSCGTISAAPWGSPLILPISWAYIKMLGEDGLRRSSEIAILNANYIAKRLEPEFPVLFKGANGSVAHECIIDVRPIKEKTGVDVEDIAKRLMDYGFHAPTISFPVMGTMMIEPTESESKSEIDRFCDAMIEIRREVAEIETGKMDRSNNVLKNAPHSIDAVISDEWNRPYSRSRAVTPLPWVKERKVWPYVSRIDNVYGDRNLICTCPPISNY